MSPPTYQMIFRKMLIIKLLHRFRSSAEASFHLLNRFRSSAEVSFWLLHRFRSPAEVSF